MTAYKEAGVDIKAADKAVEESKTLVKKTFNNIHNYRLYIFNC